MAWGKNNLVFVLFDLRWQSIQPCHSPDHKESDMAYGMRIASLLLL